MKSLGQTLAYGMSGRLLNVTELTVQAYRSNAWQIETVQLGSSSYDLL